MAPGQEIPGRPADRSDQAKPSILRLDFDENRAFEIDVRQRVDAYFQQGSGRLGPHGFPRPTGSELVIFVVGKVVFFTWAVFIPLMFHSFFTVLFYYIVGAVMLGSAMAVVFQLPHCVAQAKFPLPRKDTGRMETPWAVHQAQATLDFGRPNRILRWPLGGLNFHLEHHLFPTICHVHYPAITKIVEQACRDHGVEYAEHQSFRAGFAAHYRWLRRMGAAD